MRMVTGYWRDKKFRNIKECNAYIARIKEKLEEYADDVWLTVEQVYETRWDCNFAWR